MAAGTAPIFEAAIKDWGVSFASGDTTTIKDIATGLTTGNAAGSRVDAVYVSTNDTTAVNLAFYLYDGSTAWYLCNVNVPIGSGYTTVARVEAMGTLAPSLGYLVLPNGWKLQANCVATMTTGKITTVIATGGDY